MIIPKIIYQTYINWESIPEKIKNSIGEMKDLNKNYRYEFYDDNRIIEFIQNNFDKRTLELYKKLKIGAAKADFFRYSILYKYGGVYVDLDSTILINLDSIIKEDDVAIMTKETHSCRYVQWALIYAPNHPFLKKTILMILDNLENDRYRFDIINRCGPELYTQAIKSCLKINKSIKYRLIQDNWNNHKYICFKMPDEIINDMYDKKKNKKARHSWRTLQRSLYRKYKRRLKKNFNN